MARKDDYTNEVDKMVATRVKELRLALGLSREQLAKMVGITQQQIQKYEVGSNRITIGRLKAIGKALGKHVAYFVDDDEEVKIAPEHHQRLAIEISRNFMKIKSVSNQYAASQLVKILAENK